VEFCAVFLNSEERLFCRIRGFSRASVRHAESVSVISVARVDDTDRSTESRAVSEVLGSKSFVFKRVTASHCQLA
jgi:hypothetical protein